MVLALSADPHKKDYWSSLSLTSSVKYQHPLAVAQFGTIEDINPGDIVIIARNEHTSLN